MQAVLESEYPGIMRPIDIKQYRYNQHLTAGSLILEVGSNGNTLNESEEAIICFADGAGRMLLEMVEQ